MPRKEFTFGYSGTVSLRLDPKEYSGCSVREIERQVRETVRAASGEYDVDEMAVTTAAMALAGG